VKTLQIPFLILCSLVIFNSSFGCYVSHLSKDSAKNKELLWKKFKLMKKISFDEIDSCDISDDCRYVALGYEDKNVCIYDLDNKSNIVYKYSSDSAFEELKFYPCGDYFLSGHLNGTVILHDIRNQDTILSYKHEHNALFLLFSHDYRYIISGHANESIVIHDAKTDKRFFEMRHVHDADDGYEEAMEKLLVSENDAYLASFCECGLLRLLDMKNKKELHVSLGGVASDVVFTSDSTEIVVASEGRAVIIDLKKLFALATRRDVNLDDDLYEPCRWHFITEGVLNDVRLSKDGRFLIAGGLMEKVCFYDLKTRKPVLELSLVEPGEEGQFAYFINSLHFSEDENTVIIAGAKINETLSGKGFVKIGILQKDENGIVNGCKMETIYISDEPYNLCFSEHKRYLGVMSSDLNVFDLKKKECLLTVPVSLGRAFAKFSPDSDKFILLDLKNLSCYKTPSCIYFNEKKRQLAPKKNKVFREVLSERKTKKQFVDCSIKYSAGKKLEGKKGFVGSKRKRKTGRKEKKEEGRLYPFKRAKVKR